MNTIRAIAIGRLEVVNEGAAGDAVGVVTNVGAPTGTTIWDVSFSYSRRNGADALPVLQTVDHRHPPLQSGGLAVLRRARTRYRGEVTATAVLARASVHRHRERRVDTAPSGTLTLDAGASSATITIRTLDDMLLHRGELLVVVPTGTTTSTGAVTGESTAAQTTIDDQGTITVSVTADATAVTQGDGATFTVTLSGAVANALAVGSSMSDRTATSRTNYAAGPSVDGSVPGQLAGDAEHHRAYA